MVFKSIDNAVKKTSLISLLAGTTILGSLVCVGEYLKSKDKYNYVDLKTLQNKLELNNDNLLWKEEISDLKEKTRKFNEFLEESERKSLEVDEFFKSLSQKKGIETIVIEKDTKGSVDLDYLNDFENYKPKDFLNFCESVAKHESRCTFFKTTPSNGLYSKAETYKTLFDNLRVIESVKSGKTENLKEDYYSLINLINDIDYIKENNNQIDALPLIYDKIYELIRPGVVTKDSKAILELTNGFYGDCNDITPAYISLLTYAGYDCGIIFSQVKQGESDEPGGHAWLAVGYDDKVIELDPTWHPAFVPLKRATKDY